MKIRISFLPEEAMKAQAVVSLLRPILDSRSTVKEYRNHPPRRQLYITTKQPRVDKAKKV